VFADVSYINVRIAEFEITTGLPDPDVFIVPPPGLIVKLWVGHVFVTSMNCIVEPLGGVGWKN